MQEQAPIIRDRLTDSDKKLIRDTFKDSWVTLEIIRNVFFGFQLTEWEKKVVKELSADIKILLRKIFLPEITRETPIGQSKDLWFNAGNNIKGDRIPDMVMKEATAQVIRFVSLSLDRLNNPDLAGVSLEIDTTNLSTDESSYKLIARQNFIVGTEQQLVALNTMAYQKEETPVETKARMQKDSTK
jgi:hypothetical protein